MVYSFALTCWWALRRAQIQFENRNQKRHRTGQVRTVLPRLRAGQRTNPRIHVSEAVQPQLLIPLPPPPRTPRWVSVRLRVPLRACPCVSNPTTNPNSLHASPVFSIGHHDGSTCLPDSCVHLPGSPHPPQPLLPRSACCCARAIIAQACVGTCRVQLYPDPLVH